MEEQGDFTPKASEKQIKKFIFKNASKNHRNEKKKTGVTKDVEKSTLQKRSLRKDKIFSGWLLIRNLIGSNRWCWFILDSSSLSYYRHSGRKGLAEDRPPKIYAIDEYSKGTRTIIPIEVISHVSVGDIDRAFSLQFFGDDESFVLEARDPFKCQEWRNKISETLINARSNNNGIRKPERGSKKRRGKKNDRRGAFYLKLTQQHVQNAKDAAPATPGLLSYLKKNPQVLSPSPGTNAHYSNKASSVMSNVKDIHSAAAADEQRPRSRIFNLHQGKTDSLSTLKAHGKIVFEKAGDKGLEVEEFLKSCLDEKASLIKQLFRKLDDEAESEFIQSMEKMIITTDCNLLKQGVANDLFFIIKSGTFDVFETVDVEIPDSKQFRNSNSRKRKTNKLAVSSPVGSWGRGGLFGEEALVCDKPSPVTVRFNSDGDEKGVLFFISRQRFKEITNKCYERIQEFKLKFLEIPLLKASKVYKIDDQHLLDLVDLFEFEKFSKEEILFNEGDIVDKMYFVLSGGLAASDGDEWEESDVFGDGCRHKSYFVNDTIRVRDEGTTLLSIEMRSFNSLLKEGKEFFEKELLRNKRFSKNKLFNQLGKKLFSTVRKKEDSMESLISFNDSQSLGMNSMESMGDIRKRLTQLSRDSVIGWVPCSPLLKTISHNDVSLHKKLGEGSFSKVVLASYKKKFYALKCLIRSNLVDLGWEERTNTEILAMREISSRIDCAFLIKCYHCFADTKFIYMLLELAPGGDMFEFMRAKYPQGMPESIARFYFASVILALKALHEKNIIHRDLKPENLVICSSGYPKLADFGLARKAWRTSSVVGTPEYMAPEIILQKAYGKAVDWWAAGCVMYELVCGQVPFRAHSHNARFRAVVAYSERKNPKLEFENESLKRVTCAFIMNMIHPKPHKRLGMKRNEIEGHYFFKQFSWNLLKRFKIKPPFIPTDMTQDFKLNTKVNSFNIMEPEVKAKKLDFIRRNVPSDDSGWIVEADSWAEE